MNISSDCCAAPIPAVLAASLEAIYELKAALPSTPVQDVPLELARTFGIRRLAAGARTRLEAVIRLSVQHHNGDRN